MKDSYLLYRKEGRTAIVLICEDDEQVHYLLSKLSRTRNKELKEFAKGLLIQFTKESSDYE